MCMAVNDGLARRASQGVCECAGKQVTKIILHRKLSQVCVDVSRSSPISGCKPSLA